MQSGLNPGNGTFQEESTAWAENVLKSVGKERQKTLTQRGQLAEIQALSRNHIAICQDLALTIEVYHLTYGGLEEVLEPEDDERKIVLKNTEYIAKPIGSNPFQTNPFRRPLITPRPRYPDSTGRDRATNETATDPEGQAPPTGETEESDLPPNAGKARNPLWARTHDNKGTIECITEVFRSQPPGWAMDRHDIARKIQNIGHFTEVDTKILANRAASAMRHSREFAQEHNTSKWIYQPANTEREKQNYAGVEPKPGND